MTDTRSDDSPSVIDRTHEVAAEGSVIAAYFLGRTAAFVLSEEAIVLAAPDGEPQRIGAHGGAILATTSDGKRRWIDQIALAPDGAVAWSAGKTAFVQAKEKTKEQRQFEAPSTVGGLAFLPKGFRLAIAHYNGATLWFPNAAHAEPEKLEWKGSHLG